MQTLTINRKAREVLAFLRANEAVINEQSTRAVYLWFLAAHYPAQVGFDELVEALGLTKSQVSRITRDMHKLGYSGEPGFDLIDIAFDLRNPRLKLVGLNAKGLQAVQGLLELWK